MLDVMSQHHFMEYLPPRESDEPRDLANSLELDQYVSSNSWVGRSGLRIAALDVSTASVLNEGEGIGPEPL